MSVPSMSDITSAMGLGFDMFLLGARPSRPPHASIRRVEKPGCGRYGRAPRLSSLSLCNRKSVLNYFQQRANPGGNVRAQMHAYRSPMTTRQRLKITERLSLLQYAEGKRLVRQRHVHGVVGSHLDEHAGCRTALVKLTGRVQKAWSVAGGGRNVDRIPQVRPNRLNQVFVLGSFLNVVEHRNVVARMRATKMRRHETFERT